MANRRRPPPPERLGERTLARLREAAAEEEDPLRRLRALARGQDGQFATTQAKLFGLQPPALRWLRDNGETTLLRKGVWRFRTTPGDPDPAVTAYLLCWPHGVISHASAGRHHGLSRVALPADANILMPLSYRRRPAGVTVHVTRNLPFSDIVQVGAVSYTSLARTVCDLVDADKP